MQEVFEKLHLKEVGDNEFRLTALDAPRGPQGSSQIHRFFKTDLIEPDDVKRPDGDTTFFTTAGVQHLETMYRQRGDFDHSFSVYQPCVRSQFMKETREGTSTSFVNFSSVLLEGGEKDFIEHTNAFINILVSNGVEPEDIKFVFAENVPSVWQDKQFGSNNLTLCVNDVEIGESIWVKDFPLTEQKHTSLIEVGLGVERLDWALGKNKYYLPAFNKIYEEHKDRSPDEICSLIDSIRTSTLIIGSGVVPSPKNHGYRARKLLKKFNDTNNGLLNADELVAISHSEWQAKGARLKLQPEIIQLIVNRETERLDQIKKLKNPCNQNYDYSDIKDMVARILGANERGK